MYIYILYIYNLEYVLSPNEARKIELVLQPLLSWNSVCRIEEISKDIPAPNNALRRPLVTWLTTGPTEK